MRRLGIHVCVRVVGGTERSGRGADAFERVGSPDDCGYRPTVERLRQRIPRHTAVKDKAVSSLLQELTSGVVK